MSVRCIAAARLGAIYAGTDTFGVYRSIDEGSTWIPLTNNIITRRIWSMAVSAQGVVFMGADSGRIYRSTDQGTSWLLVRHWESSSSEVTTALGVHANGYVFAGEYRGVGVVRSEDNGSTWTGLGGGIYPSSFGFKPDKYVFLGRAELLPGGGVLRSTNYGTSWTQTGSLSNYVFALTINSVGTLFAGTSGGVWVSTNDGDSWVQTMFDSISNSAQTVAVDSQQYVFAGTLTGKVYRSTLPTK